MSHQDLLNALRLVEEDDQSISVGGEDDDDNDGFTGAVTTSSRDSYSSSTKSIPLGDEDDEDAAESPPANSDIPLSPPVHPFSPSTTTTTTFIGDFDPTATISTPRTSVDGQSISLTSEEKAIIGAGVGVVGVGVVAAVAASRHDEKRTTGAPGSAFDPNVISHPPINRTSTSASSVATTKTTSSVGRKERPDPIVMEVTDGSLILGIALVDFNHSVGPKVEMAHPESLLQDEELCKILPFLALPDGAHQSAEDYSYFHLTLAGGPKPESTVFGISCNRQIASADLIERGRGVSRSTVQKAVVVLASKPVFGPIRDKLGVVTRAFFNQRDFRDTHILMDFYSNLQISLKTQLTESGLYMGTSLRELVHKFRHRTLILLKMLMLQKKIMFYGHPVERLCTYQYSLVSLMPNLFLALEDAASPNLDRREGDTSRPTELRTSDRNSLMKYLGLPLNVFGRDSFFQPYLPLQQVDMLKTQSWLCGTTNSIVTQQKDSLPDLLVNIELNTFEYKDPQVEKLAALTPSDRKWMDDLVKDVNEGWNEKDPSRPLTMQFKGSDDYLRAKFEDYVCSSLATVKYADFLLKASKADVGLAGATGGEENVVDSFGELWIAAFRTTKAYELWNIVTDPAIFDICEPRHPCESKPTPISDIGLRLAEGLHELKVAETVAPAREAITNAISVGSSGLFRAFEGVRSEVAARMARPAPSSSSVPTADSAPPGSTASTTPTGATLLVHSPPLASSSPLSPIGSVPSKSIGLALSQSTSSTARPEYPPPPNTPPPNTGSSKGLRPLSLAPASKNGAAPGPLAGGVDLAASAQAAKATVSSWGSFLAKKAADFKKSSAVPAGSTTPPASSTTGVTGASANGTPFA